MVSKKFVVVLLVVFGKQKTRKFSNHFISTLKKLQSKLNYLFVKITIAYLIDFLVKLSWIIPQG